MIRVGTSGWNLPAPVRDRFPAGDSQLARYAQAFRSVEITSSFYRPHRRATYERWASAVPDGFRFAVKLPKTVTHERRLDDAEEPLARFLDETAGLGAKREIVLVQLAPRHAFDPRVAAAFIVLLRRRYDGRVAWEPRHPSWFASEPEALLAAAGIARVAADPAIVPAGAEPGGAATFAYYRWHGSPQLYSSAYDDARLAALAARLRDAPHDVWAIFDNTRLGAAAADALRVRDALAT